MTSEERARRIARIGATVTTVALIGLIGVYVRALQFTPVERFQGPAQKIYYIHVPSAWTALIAFSITGILSIVYLWLRDERIDLLAAASAEVGLAFSLVLLTTGPIWGKPVWGTWWTWDARLTSTLFIFLLFVGYTVMRGVVTDRDLTLRVIAEGRLAGQTPASAIMSHPLRTVNPELPLDEVVEILRSNGVRRLPIGRGFSGHAARPGRRSRTGSGGSRRWASRQRTPCSRRSPRPEAVEGAVALSDAQR